MSRLRSSTRTQLLPNLESSSVEVNVSAHQKIACLSEEIGALRTQIGELEVLHRDLLATIGHELRTPVTVILGLSEILLDSACLGCQRLPQGAQFLQQILRASEHLSQLVERSLMLSRLYAGELEVDPHALELWEAVDRTLCLYAPAISEKQLSIARKISPDLPLVWIDGTWLDAVLQALIDNAIKFNNPTGSITLVAQPQRNGVVLRVSSSGVGIPADKLKRIFRLFDQGELGLTRRFGGLGIGLPLVKQLLEKSGGAISARSAGDGKGASFSIWLPQAVPTAVT